MPLYVSDPWRMSGAEQAEYGVELGGDHPEPMVDPDARYAEMR